MGQPRAAPLCTEPDRADTFVAENDAADILAAPRGRTSNHSPTSPIQSATSLVGGAVPRTGDVRCPRLSV
ncbi:hypothetical protein F4561_003194 [Lipingzhangella halophila]|uniref:Uncharacterized protein n=1 Tax=Lipingzhangella halophila TaxID=1783352 RepID=A0A7W7RI38_9ACTN|nr:hypothetical protein [Lipingzhangella halophila]